MTQEERKKFLENINYAKKHNPALYTEIRRNFMGIRIGFEIDDKGNVVGLKDLVGQK